MIRTCRGIRRPLKRNTHICRTRMSDTRRAQERTLEQIQERTVEDIKKRAVEHSLETTCQSKETTSIPKPPKQQTMVYYVPLAPRPVEDVNDSFLAKLEPNSHDNHFTSKERADTYDYYRKNYYSLEVLKDSPHFWKGYFVRSGCYAATIAYFMDFNDHDTGTCMLVLAFLWVLNTSCVAGQLEMYRKYQRLTKG